MREARHFTNRPSELRGYARIPEVMSIPNRTMQVKRVQRKRTKGWRMPANAKYCGRPTKWGNPFKIDDYNNRSDVIRRYEFWLRERLKDDPHFLDPLKGKDLACFCPLDKACHVDVILKILSEVSK